jgi:hypothetical protein
MSSNKLAAILKILDDQNTLGARADTKAVAFLSSLGIFTAFFIAFAKDIDVNYFTIIVLTIYIFATIMGMYNIIMTIYPRTRTNLKATDKDILDPHKAAFFADISSFSCVADYKKCLEEMLKDDETVMEVYTKQIYEVSRLTASKYKYAQRTVYYVMLALAAEFSLIAYVFASKALG